MSNFCKNCNNLLMEISTSDTFYFECESCKIKYKPNHNDSLRLVEKKGTNMLIYRNILLTAGSDPLNPKIKKDCKKCKNTIARQVRVGENMQLINVCTKCDYKWSEAAEQFEE